MTLTARPHVQIPDAGLRSLPAGAQAYVCGTVAAGMLCVVFAVPRVHAGSLAWTAALIAIGLLTATLRLSLPLVHGRSSMSFSYAVVLFAMLTTGTAPAVLVAAGTALAQSTLRTHSRTPPHRILFNVASLSVTVLLAGSVFSGLRDGAGGWWWALAGPLGIAVLVYFTVNTALVASAVALTTRQPLARVWRDDFMWSAPGYFVGAAAAGLASVLAGRSGYWWVATLAIPIYMTFRSYRIYVGRMKASQVRAEAALEVQFATVQALALAIESRDRTSQSQLHRLTIYAEGLGRAAGLDEVELHALRTAALLHDVGNLAVPEHILAKPGLLTFEEFQKVKIHPRVGAEILRGVPFAAPVAPVILAHHEHWDGSGYPSGLKGAAIPLAARVLSVADCFTAVLSDRPHRRGFPYWEALALMERCAGTWLDPTLVERFVEILPHLEAQITQLPHPGDDSVPSEGAPISERAMKDIAVARHEARALFEIAQALVSTLGVSEALETIVTKLSALIPIESGALFLWDERAGRFTCRYATGAAQSTVMGLDADTLEAVRSRVEIQVESGSALAPTVVLVSPLLIDERLLGALTVVVASGARDDHQRLLEHVSGQAALVIHNAMAFEETRQLSLTDPLTDLPNRRYLVQHLGHELARAERRGCPVALLLMDVDDFKRINDTYGHAVGDRLLCEIGSVTRSLLRPYDICARIGGDEFVVVLWDCDADQAERRRLGLEQALCSASVPLGTTASAVPSVSIGIAGYPLDGRRPDQLLAVADQRMYACKASHHTSDSAREPAAV